jgi:hypothetical protein
MMAWVARELLGGEMGWMEWWCPISYLAYNKNNNKITCMLTSPVKGTFGREAKERKHNPPE